MLHVSGKTLLVAETGQPFRALDTVAVTPYTGFYHEKVGNMVVGKGQVFAWLYSSPAAIAKLSTGEYDLVFFPPGRSAAMAYQVSVLDQAWQANRRRGHQELLALVDGWLTEHEGRATLLIRRMSVRKKCRRNGLNTQLIKVLHANFSDHALAFEDLTEDGYQFVRRTFPEAAHVWTSGTSWRPKAYLPAAARVAVVSA